MVHRQSTARPHLCPNHVLARGLGEPAIGMMDDHDLFGGEDVLGSDERAEGVGRSPASDADDVRFAELEVEHLEEVETGVHACDDGDACGGRGTGIELHGVDGGVRRGGVDVVAVRSVVVGGGHGARCGWQLGSGLETDRSQSWIVETLACTNKVNRFTKS